MARASFRQYLHYRFDAFMARGGVSIFISLVVVFTGVLVLLTLLRAFVNSGDFGLEENAGGTWHQLYMVFIQLSDPGNMAYDIKSSLAFKVAAVLSGIAGVLILSSLIAFITTALNIRLERLKRGRSRVVEKDHTLILGWSDATVEVIRELIFANESESNPVIVVLAFTPKEHMDDFLQVRLPSTKNTRLVTRYGNTALPANLDVASLATAKSVIVLARAGDTATAEERAASDAKVIKTCLAVEACKPRGKKLNVVAELFDESNRQVVREITPGEFIAVDDDEILAKLIAQTSRSAGLSVVYNEILSFDGCEIYFHHDEWGAMNFGELQFHFKDGVPIGICEAQGKLELDPPANRPMKADDEILIVAQDDSTIQFQSKPVVVPLELELQEERLVRRIESALVMGWNERAPAFITEYADYVLDRSGVDVMVADADDEIRRRIQVLDEQLPTLEINLIEENPLKSEDLLKVEPFSYDSIILLSNEVHGGDLETTDSETIMKLLLLRKILADHPEQSKNTSIITEVLHADNQALIARAGVNDSIISTRLVSMMLAQMSEEPRMCEVYEEIFKEDGSEIYVKPARLYRREWPASLRFGDLMQLAQQRGETCIGVKMHGDNNTIEANFGVELIPPKDKVFSFGPQDFLVVVAEDET